MQDFITKGNFASVSEEIYKSSPIYAFVFDGRTKTFVNCYKVHFALYVGYEMMSLILTNDDNIISRYNDFITCKRLGYYSEDMWDWDIDEIGLSIVSHNASKNIIYFGTEKTDSTIIRSGLYSGKRNVKKNYDDAEAYAFKQAMRRILRKYQIDSNKNINKRTEMLCLPEPKKEVIVTTEVVYV